MENNNICDACPKIYVQMPLSIPLDKDWIKLSGSFCSMKCAAKHNQFVNTSTRMVMDWEERDVWMKEKIFKNINLKIKKIK